MKRAADPAEIAEVVAFLASPRQLYDRSDHGRRRRSNRDLAVNWSGGDHSCETATSIDVREDGVFARGTDSLLRAQQVLAGWANVVPMVIRRRKTACPEGVQSLLCPLQSRYAGVMLRVKLPYF
jgi:hypothetical protein